MAGVTRDLIVLGVSLSISFILLLAAGIAFHNWLPMLNLAAVILIPVAVIMSESIGGASQYASYDEIRQAWNNFGSCIFGILLVSFIGLPLILLHSTAIQKEEFGLWIASTVVTMFGAIFYWSARMKARTAY